MPRGNTESVFNPRQPCRMMRTTCYVTLRMLLQQKCPLHTDTLYCMDTHNGHPMPQAVPWTYLHNAIHKWQQTSIYICACPEQPHRNIHLQCTACDAIALVKLKSHHIQSTCTHNCSLHAHTDMLSRRTQHIIYNP